MAIEKVRDVSKSLSPLSPRRRCRSFDLVRGPDPSPAASSIHEAEGVMGALRQSLTTDATPTLAPMLATIADVMETWPGSPCGVPRSLSSAIHAHAVVARVRGQQQQSETSEVEMVELDVAIGR